MKITRIEMIPVAVPIHPDRMITSSRGPHDHSPFLIVRVHSDEGLIGLGEVSCTPQWSGEDSTTARHVIETYLYPSLIGKDPTDVELLSQHMGLAIVGHQFTKAAVEMALWDLAGKAYGQPCYKLFGGALRSRIQTKFSITGFDADRAASVASWAFELGFRAMKVKVGGAVDVDAAKVTAVRSVVGESVLLGVDANGGWSRAQAATAVEWLGNSNVAFLEQPIAASDLEGMAWLRQRSSLPIVADESVASAEDVYQVARAEAADLVSIYVGMAGGIGAARRAAATAEAAGMGWTIGSNLELGIGLAAHLHLAVSTPGLRDDLVPCDILSPFYYQDDLLVDPLTIAPGWAEAPSGVGLGVEIDDLKLARYRVD